MRPAWVQPWAWAIHISTSTIAPQACPRSRTPSSGNGPRLYTAFWHVILDCLSLAKNSVRQQLNTQNSCSVPPLRMCLLTMHRFCIICSTTTWHDRCCLQPVPACMPQFCPRVTLHHASVPCKIKDNVMSPQKTMPATRSTTKAKVTHTVNTVQLTPQQKSPPNNNVAVTRKVPHCPTKPLPLACVRACLQPRPCCVLLHPHPRCAGHSVRALLQGPHAPSRNCQQSRAATTHHRHRTVYSSPPQHGFSRAQHPEPTSLHASREVKTRPCAVATYPCIKTPIHHDQALAHRWPPPPDVKPPHHCSGIMLTTTDPQAP
jgi:hypothetical protein